MTAQVEMRVPDIGNAKDVTVIEILVKPGDKIAVNDSIVTLEGDKASMEVPATQAGTVESIKVKVGDKVSEGAAILVLKTDAPAAAATPTKADGHEKAQETKPAAVAQEPSSPATSHAAKPLTDMIHAGPGVRRLAREMGTDLQTIAGSGPKGRILKEDLHTQAQGSGGAGFSLPSAPVVDFAKFGEVEVKPLNKIKRATGVNLHRNWVTIPHVTQFDEADITDMEAFRQAQKALADAKGVKLTLLVFIMKAIVACLKKFPVFNASLDATGENLVVKKYFHIGIAVDTPNGLVVPVIRDVDKKGMFDLAQELADISKKAREKGLTPADMSGSCFTISSLGGIGGTAFTPIVNAPDVAILGISKAQTKPVYMHDEFVPRLMLPLSLSYDHRVIDGADGARFVNYLVECLSDIRRLLL